MRNLDDLVQTTWFSKKEAYIFLTALCAARRKESSMIYFAKQAKNYGAEIEELAELIGSAIISRGIPTWLSGVEVLQYFSQTENEPLQSVEGFQSIEECIQYYENEFEIIPVWVEYLIKYLPDTLLKYSNLRTTSLRDGRITRLQKELLLYAINICDFYDKGIKIHKTNASQLGATQAIFQEVKGFCIIASGIDLMWIDEE